MARIYLSGYENFYYEVRPSLEGPSTWLNRAHLYAERALVRDPRSAWKVETVWLSNTAVANRTERDLYNDMLALAEKYAQFDLKTPNTYVRYNPSEEEISEALLSGQQTPKEVHIHKERSYETPVTNTIQDSPADKKRCQDLRLLRGIPILAGWSDYRSQSKIRRVFDCQ